MNKPKRINECDRMDQEKIEAESGEKIAQNDKNEIKRSRMCKHRVERRLISP